jgi:hypothetical protein
MRGERAPLDQPHKILDKFVNIENATPHYHDG